MGPPRAVLLVFLETRAHVDLSEMSDEQSAGLGRMIVRVDETAALRDPHTGLLRPEARAVAGAGGFDDAGTVA